MHYEETFLLVHVPRLLTLILNFDLILKTLTRAISFEPNVLRFWYLTVLRHRCIMKRLFFWYQPRLLQGSTLTFLATCPFGQVTKKLTCPNTNITCQIFFIKFKYCKLEKCIKVITCGLCISYLLRSFF
jgi:hypothetical protein